VATGRARDQGWTSGDNGLVRLLIISDTHLPTRARVLPTQVWQQVAAADVVFHAGDWVSTQLLDDLDARAPRLVGVYGNNDGPELRARLPEIARVTLDGVRFAVIHQTGDKTGRELRADRAFPDTDVLVFGHSHIPWDSTSPAGLRLLNPGSPTDRRRQPAGTYLTAELLDGRLEAVALHALPPRS
jgi:putative phosphoesterase